MSFVLNVDADRWRNHVSTVASTVESVTGSRIVPVIKGNGYGLGQARLARVAESLPGTIVAVGTVFELEEVLTSCLIECTLLLLSFELFFVLLSVLVKLGSNDKTQTDEASEMNSH